MKKTIFISLLIVLGSLLIFKSDIPTRMRVFTLTVPTGTDTTYYFEFWHSEPWGAEVQYKNFDAADAVRISSRSVEKIRTNSSGMKNRSKKDMIHHDVLDYSRIENEFLQVKF